MDNPSRISGKEAHRLRERFLTRAQAVFFARIVCSVIGLTLLVVPAWQAAYVHDVRLGAILLSVYFASTILSRIIAPHPVHGRWAMFLSLLVDLAALLVLVIGSGGLQSPFMGGLILLTIFFALLFPNPIAITPPFMMLPAVTALSLSPSTGTSSLSTSIFLVILHAVLNGVAMSVVVYLTGREEKDAREILELETELKKLAVVEERNRLARDIHDGTGAALSGLIIQSEYLQTLAKGDEGLFSEITELKSAAEEAIDEVRRALTMMRDEFVLVPQLENTCTTFTTRSKIPIELNMKGEVPAMPDDQQLTIFRILQECLTNIAKHAEPSLVKVDVHFDPEQVSLVIEDDGKGFDPGKTPKHHYGLINMKERARKINGTVEINSSPGEGTKVSLMITPGAKGSSGPEIG